VTSMAAVSVRWRRRHLFGLRLAMIVLAFVLGGLGRVAETPAAVAGTSRPDQGKTFLWAVSSSTATVHLLGSIHVASPDTYPLDPRIESAFERSRILILEAPLDPAAQMEMALTLTRAGTYPEGETIDLRLDHATLERLQEQLKKVGIPFATVRSLRPWLLATVLIVGEMQRLGYQPSLGIDRYFAEKATGRKQVLTLETVDEQVTLFAGMSETMQESVLRETLARMQDLQAQMKRVFALWRSGDAQTLDGSLVAPIRRDYPELHKKLFADRNRRMAAAVEGYLGASGDHFVVVGSGHLTGPEGILELLRAKGYTPVQR
jgi:uncharacterized protein YbaP (TraB family)